MILKGWIAKGVDQTPEEAKNMLESLGVSVGPYDDRTAVFEQCEVDDAANMALKAHWQDPRGMVWGLSVCTSEQSS